ncbi:exo-beta-N-acetylmuramidase NamZ domain-containing protein [Planctomycetes bacterium K23_9]|uniref:DUF1343 domain-containing protein n=1 Tax=Stieleria marina TaxID=1930275 RepID=A0A517NNC3_9BACT|nr:hypothetical protein K239x_05500 [Planctomycetes bacterium K23_9]
MNRFFLIAVLLLPVSDYGNVAKGQGRADIPSQVVLAGIDVLRRDNFSVLADQKVALITNQTGVTGKGESTVELLFKADTVDLVALFSPEHGFAGTLDQSHIGDARDDTTGLTVRSLYGKTRVPTPEMLAGIDTLVFDIQDIGTRFYTYISTMGSAMKAAGQNGVRFVVLDRPNPIGGVDVHGPILDAGSESFVGFHPIAVRHGMTVGELAKMFQSELKIEVDLVVVPVEGWQREQMFDATGRLWVNPSPNMRNLNQALLYPGVGLWEMTNLSVGRGTDTPFEHIGAPWIDPVPLAGQLNDAGLSGVRFVPTRFVPASSKYENESCGGVHFLITNRAELDPLRLGMTLATTLRSMYPEQWETSKLDRLLSSQATADLILAGKGVDEIVAAYQGDLQVFKKRRATFLIYPETESR